MSRTALQDRFRKTLRRSVHDVIVEARLTRVKEFLAATSLSVEEIAERTGFAYPEYMSIILKQRTGWTPARYRREHRGPLAHIENRRSGDEKSLDCA
jgi:LacI family transcriptional regulator